MVEAWSPSPALAMLARPAWRQAAPSGAQPRIGALFQPWKASAWVLDGAASRKTERPENVERVRQSHWSRGPRQPRCAPKPTGERSPAWTSDRAVERCRLETSRIREVSRLGCIEPGLYTCRRQRVTGRIRLQRTG